MILESQVCSLEHSKRLKEFGVKQDSLFYYTAGGVVYRGEMPFWLDSNYSAFTVAELIEILPVDIKVNEIFYSLKIVKEYGWWGVYYNNDIDNTLDTDKTNLADALAEILILLIETDLIKVEEINN